MAEIPSLVWILVGLLVSIVSIFLGFIPPYNNHFFKLMFFVGLGMIGFGILKIKFTEKTIQQRLEERRYQLLKERGETEVEIDIDDYRRNPELRQRVISEHQNRIHNPRRNHSSNYFSKGHSQTQQNSSNGSSHTAYQNTYSTQINPSINHFNQQNIPKIPSQNFTNSHSKTNQHTSSHHTGNKFCTQCGTPLLKEHKYCPICGARI